MTTRRGTVLVIEDEKAIRDLLRLHLDLTRFEVREASDGRRGLDLARVERRRLCLAICDLRFAICDLKSRINHESRITNHKLPERDHAAARNRREPGGERDAAKDRELTSLGA